MELISKEVVRRIIDSERTREQMIWMVEGMTTVEPCEDAVSREDARRLHCKICRDYCTCYRNPETCEDLKAFDSLPPVTPDASKVIEDIKTEIKETLNADWSDGLYQALRIIDRHISGKENE